MGLAAHLVSLALAVCAVFIFAKTAYPTLPGGDSGELIVAAHTLGLPHPPGYPFFTLVGHLFSRLLPSKWSVAYRVNLVSSVCTAIAAQTVFWMIYLVLKNLTGLKGSTIVWIGLLGGGGFAFFPLVWTYALQAEVFGMSSMFAGMLMLQTVRTLISPTEKNGYLGAFLIGLGLTNQHTLIFFAIPAVVWIAIRAPSVYLKPAVFLRLMMFGLLGLSPYIYLPIASLYRPPGGWGDQSTLEGFLTHILRAEYGTFRLYPGDQAEKNFTLALQLYVLNVQEGTAHLGFPFALIAVIVLIVKRVSAPKKKEEEPTATSSTSENAIPSAPEESEKEIELKRGALHGARCCLVVYVIYMVVFHLLSDLPVAKPLYRGVHMRFWLQPNVLFFSFIGWGVGFLLDILSKARMRLPSFLVACLCVGIVSAQVKSNYSRVDESDNYSLRDYGLAHLETLPNRSLLIVAGDMATNSIRYLQYCENVRNDIEHVDQAMMTYTWYKKTQQRHLPGVIFAGDFYNPYKENSYSMGDFLDDNSADDRPLFVCGYFNHAEQEGGGILGYVTVPMGICERIYWKENVIEFEEWLDVALEAMPPPTKHWPASPKYNAETWEYLVTNDYWAMHFRRVEHIQNEANKRATLNGTLPDQQLLKMYTSHVIDMLSSSMINIPRSPSPDYFWRNVGIAFGKLQPYIDPNAPKKMVASFKKYIELFNVTYEQAPDIWDSVILFEKRYGVVEDPGEVLNLPVPDV